MPKSDGGQTYLRRVWPRSSLLFVCAGIVYALVVIGLCAAGIWSARTQTLDMARSQATAVATFSSAYTSRMYDIADEVGRHLAEDIGDAPLDPMALTPLLVAAAEGTAQNDYFVVFNAEGEMIAGSEPMQSFRVQEDTLAEHRAGARRHIGQVVLSRGTGEIIYRVSHRIDAPDGSMAGIVGVAIRPFGIQATANRQPEAPQVTVWRSDRRFIAAAYIDFNASGAPIIPPTPPGLATTLPGQVIQRDGIIRAETRVEGFPLWVSAELDEHGVLTKWRMFATSIAGLGGFLLLLGGAFAWAGLRVSRAEETSRMLLAKAKEDAEASLATREMLLREIHHRVRNSLMLVSSFLMLQARGADLGTRAALERVQGRVTSIGLVHETLYAGADLGHLDLATYLSRLGSELSASLGAAERRIVVSTDVEHISLDGDKASTIGLIVSEAATNAVKYAFGDDGGTVVVRVRRVDEGLAVLSICDDGIGRADTAASGLGSQLLDALARQVGGRCRTYVEGGTVVEVTFPVPAG